MSNTTAERLPRQPAHERNGHAPRHYEPVEVERTLRIFCGDGVTELRLLDAGDERYPATLSGYFNDPAAAADALRTIRRARGVYFIPNAIHAALLSRSANKLRKAPKGELTQDSHVVRRRWLLIDADSSPVSGVSTTDDEHAAALQAAETIRAYLRECCAWPDPVLADSGNGAHLCYRIDEPAADDGLIENCLKALDHLCRGEEIRIPAGVRIDTSVHNPARIWKLYGTRACKGDDTPERPHRISRLLEVPEPILLVPHGLLAELAATIPSEPPNHERRHTGSAFDLDDFIHRNGLDVDGPHPWKGGRKWTFNTSPICEHHGDGPHIEQHASGAISAGCHHDSCSWDWHDLRARLEPKTTNEPMKSHATKQPAIMPVSLASLVVQHKSQRPAVIEGLLRKGEVANIIAKTKIGKSWLAYYKALSVVTGGTLFDRFWCSPGRVLLLDNELHPETIARRIPDVAAAMGLGPADYQDRIDVLSLRGRLQNIHQIGSTFGGLPFGAYQLIIIDAWYRMLPPGVSENDNAEMAGLYNLIDRYAAMTGSAFALIHHATKGSQTDKDVTDVGAGAGSQSRAADTHLILRPHEEPDCVVLEAALRSWAPVEPLTLRWVFPLWKLADLDPAALKGRGTRQEQRQREKDQDGMATILKALTEGPATNSKLRGRTGLSRDRLTRLLDALESQSKVAWDWTVERGNDCKEYRLTDGSGDPL